MKTVFIKAQNNKSRQTGFNLIEVMVAALVLSTAILGITSLQLIGMKGTQQSLMKQNAMGVVQSVIERMRANEAGVLAQNYTVNSAGLNCGTPLPNCSGVDCNPAQIALTDHLNIICGSQVGGGVFTGGVKITNATDNPILTGGILNITCAPVVAGNPAILANCASGDIVINLSWTERAFEEETVAAADNLIIQTKIGQR